MSRLPGLITTALTIAAGSGVPVLFDGAGASWTIEFAQLPGSTFNPPDLFWYVAGSATAWAAHPLWLRRTG
ncbi:hypothetical protein [Nonomuraea jabiensis]|uniref:hypothetical protein n=1 Tax=Nonomuraea jabiensis TaxID=882448 RepID=UPI003D73B773